MAIGKIQHNSQLDFAHGVRKPETVAGLSSAIMSQANTHYKLTSKLAEEGERTVKKVILYGNYAYLWSTENGYEFLIEKSRAINSRNYKEISEDIETYGIDESTDRIIRDIQALRNSKERVRCFIDTLKQEGTRTYNRKDSGTNGQQRLDTPNRTRVDGDSVADSKSKGLELYLTPQGEIYGFVDEAGEMYIDETVATSDHLVHEFSHLWDNWKKSIWSEVSKKVRCV